MGKNKKQRKGSAGLNKKESAAWLEKNGRREDVTVTASGLQYRVVDRGNGDAVQIDSTVEVHQRICLIDGTVIADTYRKNAPDTFAVAEAVDGLKEGLLTMHAGDRFVFTVAPELAWGRRGTSTIGPWAVIIFDIRLLQVL
ncbi:MAG: FKBP-type peptidyl-prolyl cis-trans isomerase [Fibrobacterota bacterium]